MSEDDLMWTTWAWTVSNQFLKHMLFPTAENLLDDVPAMPACISDHYKVGRMLGDGNFAVVRECVELSTGREYALKIINKGKCRGKVSKQAQDETHKAKKSLKVSSR